MSNKHRIKSFDLSNPFITDYIFSSSSILSKFIQLENLLIHDIKSDYLNELLIHLVSLPCLYSLVIDCIDNVTNKNIIYRQIFCIPVLKYCKLSLNEPFNLIPLPITTTEFSPIEYLIITNILRVNELNGLLSYVPQLHRLSIHLSNQLSEKYQEQYSIHLKRLKHVDLNISNMNFNDFELIIKNLFNQIEVLYISSKYDLTYLDENRLQRLILFHLRHLRIFDIVILYAADWNESIYDYTYLLDRFQSRFWFDRGWFFEYQTYYDCLERFIFYSINPYRRKSYTIYDGSNMKMYSSRPKHQINSVQFVKIEEYEDIINCKYDFPNATELTILYCYEKQNQNFLLTSFNNIIPLKQLTKLVIDSYSNSFIEIIELLLLSPNIHIFQIDLVSLEYSDLISIENSETYQLLSKTNNIIQMIIMLDCTLEIIKFFINLFPRLQYFTMRISNDNIKPVLSLLFSKDNYNTQNLFSLCIKHMSDEEFDILKNFIGLEKLFDVYLTRVKRDMYDDKVYLWW
ncbi:unnamed protein product [Rotaria sp. Silwood1]|nr:unnamed protein product [Rotaria sp. Silwood1]CAF1654851.1 unnamed protein product [Rotaria sp. Silwood1]CAF5028244.1 unnamed protein product [Rotaria sp. Silwood1]